MTPGPGYTTVLARTAKAAISADVRESELALIRPLTINASVAVGAVAQATHSG